MAGKMNNRVAYSGLASAMGIKASGTRESMLPDAPAAKPIASDVDTTEIADISDQIAAIELDIEAFVDPHGRRVKIAERRAEIAKVMRDAIAQFEREELQLRSDTMRIQDTEQAEYARRDELKARLAELVKRRDASQAVRDLGTKAV